METNDYSGFYKEVIKRSDLDVIVDAMTAQGSFIVKRIPKSEKVLFMATMDELIQQTRSCIDVAHLNKTMIAFAEDNLREKSFFMRMFKNPIPTRRLAFNVAQDIIKSIEVRFIDGGSKFYVDFYEEKFKIAR